MFSVYIFFFILDKLFAFLQLFFSLSLINFTLLPLAISFSSSVEFRTKPWACSRSSILPLWQWRCFLMRRIITLNNPSFSSCLRYHSFQHLSPFAVFPVTLDFFLHIFFMLLFSKWRAGVRMNAKEPRLCFLWFSTDALFSMHRYLWTWSLLFTLTLYMYFSFYFMFHSEKKRCWAISNNLSICMYTMLYLSIQPFSICLIKRWIVLCSVCEPLLYTAFNL